MSFVTLNVSPGSRSYAISKKTSLFLVRRDNQTERRGFFTPKNETMNAPDPRRRLGLPNCQLGSPTRQDVEQAIERAKAGLDHFESLFPNDDRLRQAIAGAETWHNAAAVPSEEEAALKKAVAVGLATQAATDAMLLKEAAAVAEETAWKTALAAALAGTVGNNST